MSQERVDQLKQLLKEEEAKLAETKLAETKRLEKAIVEVNIMKEIAAEIVARGPVSEECFNFKQVTSVGGRPLYTIYKFCQICGIQRFTDEEVKELGDPNLTLDTFLTKYSLHKYEAKACCKSKKCEDNLFALTGGFSYHDLVNAFPWQQISEYVAGHPGVNIR